MLCEVYRGYIGLGATEVFRTAAQAAADLEMVSQETSTITQYGGLRNQQRAFKYAASQGRLRDLQKEVETIGDVMATKQRELEGIVGQLEGMGVAKAGDYLKMVGKAALAYVFSEMMLIFSIVGFDPFEDKGKKKKIQALMDKADALVKELRYWDSRRSALQAEGETLSKAMDQGEGAVSVQLVAIPRVEKIVAREADPAKYGPDRVWREKKDIDVKDMAYGREMLATQQELAQRIPSLMAPSGDRLPVGFQTIYSPILEHGKMIVKNPTPPVLTTVSTRPRVVYGGLVSGLPDDVPTGVIVTGGILVLLLLATMIQKR